MEPPPPHRHARAVFLTVSAIALVAIVVVGRAVMLPFAMAIIVSYVLFPLVLQVERTKMPRWLAILVVYIVMIGSITGFGALVLPQLFDETKKLSAELPNLTRTVRDHWLPALDARLQRLTGGVAPPEPKPPPPDGAAQAPPPVAPIVIQPRDDGSYEVRVNDEVRVQQRDDGTWVVLPESEPEAKKSTFSSAQVLRDAFDNAIAYAQHNSIELLKVGQAIVSGISRGVFYFFITLMLAGYLMFTWEDIHRFTRDMWPRDHRSAFDRFLRRLDRGLAGVVRGQLLICLVNGVLSAIGFWIFDLKYWIILSIVAGVMSIIPIFGSILSTIPAVAIGLTQSFGTALGVLVWIIAIHQLEANFLNPKIIGDQAKIHPVLIVFALLFGEHFFQITGAILAVPVLALVQTVFLHFRESVLGIPAASPSIMPPPPDSDQRVSTTDRPTPLLNTKRSMDVAVSDVEPDTEDESRARPIPKAATTTLKSAD